MKELDVCFTRTLFYDRGESDNVKFPIRIQRLERDDAPGPLDGGFNLECEGKWVHCDLWSIPL